MDDFFSDGGIFSQVTGAYLDYERIQTGADLSGQSQQAVTQIPQKTNQVNEVDSQYSASDAGWLTKEVKIALGVAVAVVALVLIAKK